MMICRGNIACIIIIIVIIIVMLIMRKTSWESFSVAYDDIVKFYDKLVKKKCQSFVHWL